MEDRKRRGALVMRLAVGMAGGLMLGLVLTVAAALALDLAPGHAPAIVTIVVPAGSSEQVAAGAAPPAVPADTVLYQGDTLRLQNDDRVTHQVGTFTVPSGTTLDVPLRQATTDSLLCTFHPSGRLNLNVRARVGWWDLIWPVVAIGTPLGAAIAIVTQVAGGLDDGDADTASPTFASVAGAGD